MQRQSNRCNRGRACVRVCCCAGSAATPGLQKKTNAHQIGEVTTTLPPSPRHSIRPHRHGMVAADKQRRATAAWGSTCGLSCSSSRSRTAIAEPHGGSATRRGRCLLLAPPHRDVAPDACLHVPCLHAYTHESQGTVLSGTGLRKCATTQQQVSAALRPPQLAAAAAARLAFGTRDEARQQVGQM